MSNTTVTRYQLDNFDHQILEVLAGDARLSNRKIAQALGVTEGTIRGRLKRLQEENYLRFTAITALSYLGNPLLVFIGVTAEQGRVKEVAQAIAEMGGIRSVIITLGRFNIHVVGMYGALDDVLNVANNAILALPGVRHVETSISVKQLKYDSRLAKITRPFVPVDDDE
jgi:Lrp/AsnC family transcriptional regulator, regulator for asnA, asnC and gidA